MTTAPDLLRAPVTEVALPPLENGEHLDQQTFHARYEAMPKSVRAELVGGRVYLMTSPVFKPHGLPHSRLITWLGNYQAATPGTETYDNTSVILGNDSEPQPDACLLILPAVGGQTREDDKWIMGTPELVVEIASSSASYDLHEKREDYERYRVREYLVYAVRQRRVYWWIRRGNEYHELAPGADDVFRSETFPGLWLDAAAIIQSDGSKINETLRLGLASQEHTAFAAKLEAARKTP